MAETFLLTTLVVLATLSVRLIRRLNPQAPLAPVLAAHGLALSLCASVLIDRLDGSGGVRSLESAPAVRAWFDLGRAQPVASAASGPCAGVFRSAGGQQGWLAQQGVQSTLSPSCEAALALGSAPLPVKPER